MKDRLRLLPRDFLRTWISVFEELPPKEFIDAYELMCEALYYGFQTKEPEESGKKRGRRMRAGYFFADSSLLGVKQRVDKRLAAIAVRLRHRRGKGSRPGGSRPRGSSRVDRPADGRTGDLARLQAEGRKT